MSDTIFLTVEDLEKKWKLPKSWIYARTRESGPNAIPRIKCGKYLRFEADKVDEWFKNQGN